jgi:hypothetical protein
VVIGAANKDYIFTLKPQIADKDIRRKVGPGYMSHVQFTIGIG